MTISNELLAQVNLTEYTDEEIQQKKQLFYELLDKGEEGNIVTKLDIPIAPWAANAIKQIDGGLEMMIKDGANLSLAVKEYGYEWLTN